MSEARIAERSDIRAGDWIDRQMPAAARPYLRLMRLDRPIGTWLLLFPGWWAIALAAPPGGWPDLGLLALFGIGAVVMRGAGCVLNDIADRDFDARVARTATRPIASGAVSVRQALLLLAGLLLLGLAILLSLDRLAVLLGVLSLGLVAAYPFMKRITDWPQAWLGLTFNWGALMGWAAATGSLGRPALLLYAGGIAWTLVYDTIYAHQDKEDDALIGVRSTALRLGKASKRWMAGFAVATVLLLGAALAAAGLGWPGWVALALVALHLGWQIAGVALDRPADCLAKFRANRWLGWILLFGIVAGRLAG
jgi:4-hydroxybenzoate polyprenyltransferase